MCLNLGGLLVVFLNHILANKILSNCFSCVNSEYVCVLFFWFWFKGIYFQVQLQGQTIWLLISYRSSVQILQMNK